MISKLRRALKYFTAPPAFNFIDAHGHLTEAEMADVKRLVGKSDKKIIADFENRFSRLIGDGSCVSFSAGRMAFYSCMSAIGIGREDEVILTGFTCSVMANAILKLGAIPVYADIDAQSLGSSPKAIEKLISKRTKMIVAQHSFGIPCDIESITRIGEKYNVFVLEDCAITLGSKINGRVVGDFGHGAIFSTDHTKPLNTLIGGLFYSKDSRLLSGVKRIRDESKHLTKNHQVELWWRVKIERCLCKDGRLHYLKLSDFLLQILIRVRILDGPFLTSDYSAVPTCGSYAYPSHMPTFLAYIGILQLQHWDRLAAQRVEFLQQLKLWLKEKNMSSLLPAAYFNPDLEIIPLRLAFSYDGGRKFRQELRRFIDVEGTWFLGPLVATNEDPENFGCDPKTLPVSKKIGEDIVNIPCNLGLYSNKKILRELCKITDNNSR